MVEQYRRSPPPGTLAWVAARFGPGARVTGCRRLIGGITPSVHALRVSTGDDVHPVVLKRWVNQSDGHAQTLIDRESQLLRGLDGCGLPVPRLIACSRPEETDGHPALVMTRVPGHVDLAPRDPSRWIHQMAATLARIHDLELDAPDSRPWTATPHFDHPGWSTCPDAWMDARALLADPAPERTSFIHGDYQHFNVLWSRGVLTGVIDWTLAGVGHPDRDVGHCRLNLAVLFGPDWAERFLTVYQAEAGRTVEPWWDVYEITRYSEHWPRTIPLQVANRAEVDVEGISGRVEALLIAALR